MFNPEKVREDFPILKRKIKGKPLIYLDNAATTQKPRQVIESIVDYYSNYNANVHRGLHQLSEEASQAFEQAHKKTAEFINANSIQEIVFTKNTTEALNLAAYTLTQNLSKGDEIVISKMEHHSNFVPWQQLALQKGLKLKFIEVNSNGTLNLNDLNELISRKTKIVSVNFVSNVLGTINDVKKIEKIAHENNSIFVVDAAQAVPHIKVDVKKLNADFLAFSGHKMLGPTGIGVLYGKKHILEELNPFLFGGDMISEVSLNETSFNELPWKFEAGTPNIAGAIGLAAAIDYLNLIGLESIEKHEKELLKYSLEKLKEIDGIIFYGSEDLNNRTGVISFNLKGVHPHDVSTILNENGIAIRAGDHCAQPLMKELGIIGSNRISFYLYNLKKEVDEVVKSLTQTIKLFR